MNRGGEGEKGNDIGLYDLSVDDMYEDNILLYIQHMYSNVLFNYFGVSVFAVFIDFVLILYTEICHIIHKRKTLLLLNECIHTF